MEFGIPGCLRRGFNRNPPEWANKRSAAGRGGPARGKGRRGPPTTSSCQFAVAVSVLGHKFRVAHKGCWMV